VLGALNSLNKWGWEGQRRLRMQCTWLFRSVKHVYDLRVFSLPHFSGAKLGAEWCRSITAGVEYTLWWHGNGGSECLDEIFFSLSPVINR
jgi:hypothetical protein